MWKTVESSLAVTGGLYFNGHCIAEGSVYVQTLLLGLTGHVVIAANHEKNVEIKTGVVKAVLQEHEVYRGEKTPFKELYQVQWLDDEYVIPAVHEEHAHVLAKVLFGDQPYHVSRYCDHNKTSNQKVTAYVG
ncbi:hypothetical protein [Gracilibacillus sp. YIM 98692]|uniref:hypothetical protein n=1 Tax=Gracilibacillus sp. YIM 98692 TaxID=2663532 RepID=UPI001969E0BC|nr:hypothetical protein [Gracilibacillus sp. YIM 98692]